MPVRRVERRTTPPKIVCKILQKMIAVVGSDVLFRHLECEHSDFPTDLAVVVILKWLRESVSFGELFEVESCMTYKRVPPSVISKTECHPGFDDYEEKLRDLSEKYPITNGTCFAVFLRMFCGPYFPCELWQHNTLPSGTSH
ncbi:hypothetical protein BDN70DRAFT_877901 [Pholiota conissans]|uniref:Uncharacterized protein n=1 Tax=Pholiota conissans TaxID=109636 RepID=A0A9P6CV03_9AGAR|nr:hypothetical protein BDN70DRAFT_877901 [Pholiota conissans]